MLAIRPATPEDASAIAQAHVASWRTSYAGLVPNHFLLALDVQERASQWRHWLTLDFAVLVAELDGDVVGFAGGGPVREPLKSYDAELYTLYLLDRVQRQGTGTRLLAELAAGLSTRGYKSMLAWVLAGNASRAFYERTGGSLLAERQTEIGGVSLPIVAFGWADLSALTRTARSGNAQM